MTTSAERPIPSRPDAENKEARSSTNPGPSLPTRPGDAVPLVPDALSAPPVPGYDLLRELGRGGMGVVYQAFDRKRQRLVALKTMQGVDATSLLRFKQEFRTLTGLHHPNLVALYELIGDGVHWFFTMELIEGISFLHYVRGEDERRLRLRAALQQLAGAVQFLHESGKLHRDIKPSNILVTAQGRVVLLDFGLAAELGPDHRYHSGHLLGTVAYMAPEQAARQPVSPASDWYAVGAMLYQTLTGKLPFDGDMYQILHDKQHRDPPPPSSVVAEAPRDLEALCMDLLRRDPAARPSGEEVLRRLSVVECESRDRVVSRSASRLTSGHRLEVPLIGRQHHLRVLMEALQQTRCGRTVVVEVQGRSGAGKTALVQRFLDDLHHDTEAVILRGRCYEQESVPYKALDSLIDALSRYLERLPRAEAQALWPRNLTALARVFPVLRRLDTAPASRIVVSSDPQEVRRRALTALRELLARLGDRRPLILTIDDLQWGDEDSAALLTDLLRPPDAPVLLLVLCYRSEETSRSPCLGMLRQIQELGELERHELQVEPLTPDERRELALALLDPRDETATTRAESIARQSGGYPFFVHELVQYVRGIASGVVPASDSGGDISLSEVLWSRIGHLPEEARRLLEIVAVASRPLVQAEACRAAAVSDEQAALACLRAERLLRSTGSSEGGEIETYHDRIRETVLLHLDAPTLRHHHQRLLSVLEESGRTDPEVLAVHLVGVEELERAGHYYALAARQAAETLAFDRAAKLYRLALELQGSHGEETRRLRTKLGDALANAGRGAESARAYLSAAADATDAERLELQCRAALQFLRAGHIDDGLAALTAVLAAVGLKRLPSPRRAFWALVFQRLRLMLRGLRFRPRPPEQIAAAERTRLDICQSAAIGLSLVDTLHGAYFQTRSLLLALQLGDRDRLVTALAMEAAHLSVEGNRAQRRTRHYLDTVEAVAEQVNQPYARAMVALARGIAAALAGEWREGARLCDEAENVFCDSCTGAVWERGTAHRFALWPLMFLGDVVEINRRLPRLLKEARERDDLYEETNLCLVIRTFVRLASDEPRRARAELAQVMERWSHQGFHVQHMNRLIDDTQIDLYEGDGESAWHRLTEFWPALKRSHLLHVQQVRIVLLDLRARCALARAGAKDSASWLRLAARDARLLRREKAPWSDAMAKLLEASIARKRGEALSAVVLLEAADAAFTTADMHLHAAIARRRWGQMLGGSRGEELRRQADEWMACQTIRNPERMTALLAPGEH